MKLSIDEKALAEVVQPVVERVSKSLTRDFSRLTDLHKGEPTDSLKPLVAEVFRKQGGNPSEEELERYAQLVTEGNYLDFHA